MLKNVSVCFFEKIHIGELRGVTSRGEGRECPVSGIAIDVRPSRIKDPWNEATDFGENDTTKEHVPPGRRGRSCWRISNSGSAFKLMIKFSGSPPEFEKRSFCCRGTFGNVVGK
jgi:hypothetical protein